MAGGWGAGLRSECLWGQSSSLGGEKVLEVVAVTT